MWTALVVVANIAAIISAQSVRFELTLYQVGTGNKAVLKCLMPTAKAFDGFYNPKNEKLSNTGRFEVLEVPASGEYTLTINGVKDEDHGVYKCKAKGGTAEDEASTTVNILVAIQSVLSDYKMAIGDRGQIKLRVAGYPRPRIYWEKKGGSDFTMISDRKKNGQLVGGSRYNISTDGSLSIDNVVKSDAGVYRVNAPYPGGVAQREIPVDVGEKPQLATSPPPAMNVTKDSTITINCKFSTGITPKWSFSSSTGTTGDLTGPRVKITKESLSITKAEKKDEGTYTCSGSNEYGETKAATKLEYVIDPAKLDPFNDVEVGQGKKLMLSCSATGYPTPVVTLHKVTDGKAVKLEGQKMTAGKSDYTVDKASTDDRGTYRCTAQNGATKDGKLQVASKDAQVLIQTKPIIDEKSFTSQLKYIMGANESKLITCTAIGYPLPKVKFTKNGKVITQNVGGNATKQSVTATLSYKVTGKADLGEIVCVASNARGNATKSTTISSVEKPGVPTNVKISERETTYITVAWAAPADTGNGKISEYEIRVTNNAGKKINKIVPDLLSQIEHLEKDTEYKIAVRAKNEAGYGKYSTEVSAKTRKYSFPGPPIANKVDPQLPTNEISIRWQKPTEDGGASKIWYKVAVCRYDAKTGKFPHCETNNVGTNTSIVLKNLEPETQYKVTISAHNERGGGKSIEIRTKTGKITSKPKPKPTGPTRKERGIGGGAIAGIAIAVFLIVLIVVDLFCCFFNNCGFIHCLYETFCPGSAGKADKYQAAEKEEKELFEKNSKPAAETV